MPKLRVHNISVSLDGYAAGPNQDLDNPMGVGAMPIHDWVFATRAGQAMMGGDGSGIEPTLDDDFITAGVAGIGATIMGRNMFGPIRGSWGDDQWKGWWGPNPPYHHDTYVLTHHPRSSIVMEGGTTFHFVTDGIEAALQRAFESADGEDVRLGGGTSAIQQYLRAGLVDEMHVAIAPILLGSGERLFDNLGAAVDGYTCSQVATTGAAAHVRLTKT